MSRGWLPAAGPMKVPADVNVVRFTGFGGGAFVATPRGFVRVELRGDHRRYAVREGYRLERCLGEAHRNPRSAGDCGSCKSMFGVVAVKIPEDGAVLPEHRAKTSGRLATDFDRMAREGRAARAAQTMEEELPGFNRAWDRVSRRADRALREQLSKKRAAGLIGRKK